MNSDEFNTYWSEHHSPYQPIAYTLPQPYSDRWFRIHTLPGSKRYPETTADYEEILRRHNVLLNSLFVREQILTLITVGYSETPVPVFPDKLDRCYYPVELSRTIQMHKAGDDPEFHRYFHIWLHTHTWQPGSLNPLLQDVADDVIANVLLVEPEQQVLYHPYDGGADIILRTRQERDRLRAVYRSWLSDHPLGL